MNEEEVSEERPQAGKLSSGLNRRCRGERHTPLRHCLANKIRPVADETIHAKVEHLFDLCRLVYCPHDHFDAQVVRLFQFGFTQVAEIRRPGPATRIVTLSRIENDFRPFQNPFLKESDGYSGGYPGRR